MQEMHLSSAIFSCFCSLDSAEVYLNVHWISDVLGGFALGLFWLTLLILIFKTVTSLIGRLFFTLFKESHASNLTKKTQW